MPPKQAAPQLSEEELEELAVRTLELEIHHQDVQLKFLDNSLAKLKKENTTLVTRSNELKIRLAGVVSDADHIQHYKDSEISRKTNLVDALTEKHATLTQELESLEVIQEKLKEAIVGNQATLRRADDVIENKAQLDRKMREFQVILDRQSARMVEGQTNIERKKRQLVADELNIDKLKIRTSSRTDTKILFGKMWLVSSKKWRAEGSFMPIDKPGSTAAVASGKYLIILGGKPSQPGKDMLALDWASEPPAWEGREGSTALAQRLAEWRCGASACAIKGSAQVYIFGGLANAEPGSEVTDPQKSNLPEYNKGVLCNDLLVANIRSTKPWSKLTVVHANTMPSPRIFHAAAMDKEGTFMFVFGGRDATGLRNDLWVFSRRTNQWGELIARKGSIIPTPRMGSSLCAFDERRIVIFGGMDDEGTLNDTYLYELDRRTWSRLKTVGNQVAPPRAGHVSALFNDRYMVVAGGYQVVKDEAAAGEKQEEGGVGGVNGAAGAGTTTTPTAAGATTSVTKVGLADTWVMDVETYTWECLHEPNLVVPLKPEAAYFGLHEGDNTQRVIMVCPGADEQMSQVEVLHLVLPEEIERRKIQARQESDIIASLEVLPESDVATFWAYDEGDLTRAAARGEKALPYLAGGVLLKWTVPTKNNDRVVGYKIMATDTHGTREVGYGPTEQFYVSPRLAQYLATGFTVGQSVSLCVKAIYDDGSFLWSPPRQFSIPTSANWRIVDGQLQPIVNEILDEESTK